MRSAAVWGLFAIGAIACGTVNESPVMLADSDPRFGDAGTCAGNDQAGCPCALGATRTCYSGPAAQMNVGLCKAGTQTCRAAGELAATYGPCEGEVLPAPGIDCSGACGTVAAPRPIAPASTGRVTSLRPTLEWSLPAGVDGARVTVCRDRACQRIVAVSDVKGSTFKVPADLAPGIAFWKVAGRAGDQVGCATSPVWEFVVPKLGAPLDRSWGSIPDVNGDGFADVIVAEGPGSQHVLVYFGGPSGIGTTPDQTINAPPGTKFFGMSVASAGDVDGDGFGDVVVGSQGTVPGVGGCPAGFSEGHAWIYTGGPTGLAATPKSTLTSSVVVGACDCGNPKCDFFGREVIGAGDVNRDGFADVAIGTYPNISVRTTPVWVFYGSASGVGGAPAKLDAGTQAAYGLSAAGDVNGDGFTDVVVGTFQQDGLAGLYLGAAAGIKTTAVGLPITGFKGNASPIGAGDLNGDGLADVVQADPNANKGDTFLRFYYGAPSGVAVGPTTTLAPDTTGWTGAQLAAGDFFGRGYASVLSLVVGFNLDGQPRLVSRYDGAASGVTLPGQLALSFPQGAAQHSFVSVGDVNGDGFTDAAIYAGGGDEMLRLIYGGASGLKAVVLNRSGGFGGLGGGVACANGGI